MGVVEDIDERASGFSFARYPSLRNLHISRSLLRLPTPPPSPEAHLRRTLRTLRSSPWSSPLTFHPGPLTGPRPVHPLPARARVPFARSFSPAPGDHSARLAPLAWSGRLPSPPPLRPLPAAGGSRLIIAADSTTGQAAKGGREREIPLRVMGKRETPDRKSNDTTVIRLGGPTRLTHVCLR